MAYAAAGTAVREGTARFGFQESYLEVCFPNLCQRFYSLATAKVC